MSTGKSKILAWWSVGAYVLSRNALVDMYYTSYFTQLFRFDDIWLGLIAKKAGCRINVSDIRPIGVQYSKRPSSAFWQTCFFCDLELDFEI